MHNEVLEDLIVVKRSGQRVSFNASKVAIAIKNAFDSVGASDEKKIFKIFEKVLNHINDNYRERKTINVEDIQDIIEKTLYNEKCFQIYNSFRDYREKRALSRKVFAEKQQHKFVKAIEKIEETSLNKGNNKSADDLLYDFGKIISNEYAKSYILDTKSIRASEEGNIYIHDLDYFSLGMFPNLHYKSPNVIISDIDIEMLINDLINIEKEVYGEIAINNFDFLIEGYLLKKYKSHLIKYLKFNLKHVGFLELINFKKIEELINNEESVDIDFSKYNQYIVNSELKRIFDSAYEEAKIDLEKICNYVIYKILLSLEKRADKKTKYTISLGLNTSYIGKLIKEQTINIFNDNSYLKVNLILKIDALDTNLINKIFPFFEKNNNLYIYFVNNRDLEYLVDGIKIFNNIDESELFSQGRMVVSSTSINLARLGLKYKGKDISLFYKELDNLCELVKNELVLSFETIGAKNKEYYKALFNGNVFDDEKLENGQKIRKVIKNGVLNIGVIGLKECVLCLTKDVKERNKLLLDILNHLNRKCLEYTVDTKLNFGLYEPIDKSARKRLLAIDKAIYGTVTDVTDKKMYDLIDVDILNDLSNLGKIQQVFTSGKSITINLSGKITVKKLLDNLELLKSSDIEFARIAVGKDDC